jgi:hypothetical protein
MDAGKPQKQAVAIAYSVKRHAEHKKMGHGGPVDDCAECGAPGQYSEGGMVRKFPRHFKSEENKSEIESHDSPPSRNMPNRFTSEEDKDQIEHGDSKSQNALHRDG